MPAPKRAESGGAGFAGAGAGEVKRFSGVGARLGLALLVVLAGALGFVYLIVVPSLQNRLVNSRLSQLERAADGLARELPADRFQWPDYLDSASESANARVVGALVARWISLFPGCVCRCRAIARWEAMRRRCARSAIRARR